MALPEELRDGKIGRVPVWAVGVLLAGGIVLFMFWRNRAVKKAVRSNPGISGDTQPVTDYGVDANYGLPSGAIGDYLDSDPTNPAYPIGLTSRGVPGPITNVQWSRLAADYLNGQGNDPALVERALAKYIRGQALDAAEQSIVNIAQRVFGVPPEGLILLPPNTAPSGDNNSPTTVPPPVNAPAPSTNNNPQYVNVGAGQSVYELFGELGNIPDVFARVRTLNPGIDSRIYWVARPGDPSGNAPFFRSAMTIRVA